MRKGLSRHGYRSSGTWSTNPFLQSGPTLDLVFAGVATDLLGGYTLNTNFITPQYQIAAEYSIWVDNVGLVSKTFSDIITFTRASTGTYFDNAGVLQSAAINAPRFDYNPSTLAAQGLLIEEAMTNSLVRSAEFDNASWTKTRSTVTANTATAPDGTTSADSIVEDATAANTHDVRQGSISNTATTTWSLSFYIKAVNRTWANIELQNALATSNRARAWFNLQTGVVGSGNTAGTGVTYVSHSIQNVGNGWYRCVLVGTADVAVTTLQAWVEGTTGDNTANYDGVNGQTSVYIWGAQLEAGTFPTSYIPTTTTALTRSADVASVNTLSPWYNASAGTFYAEFAVPQLGRAARTWAVDAGTVADQIDGTVSASNTYVVEAVAASVYGGFVATANTISANTTQKSAATFSTSANETVCLNAGTVASGAVTLPTASLTTLRLGWQANSAAYINGWLRRLTFYPRQLSNAELQAITT